MSDPLALLPLALAAGGGIVRAASDGVEYEAQQLVAAGTDAAPAQRAARARAERTPGRDPPADVARVLHRARGVSEGRGAVLINPLAAPAEIAFQCATRTSAPCSRSAALASRVPPDLVVDPARRRAAQRARHRRRVSREVDLGSHFGLSLEGESDVRGRDEEAVIVYTSAMRGTPLGAVLTHANLLANARSTVEASATCADDHVLALLPFSHLFGLTVTGERAPARRRARRDDGAVQSSHGVGATRSMA